MIPDVDLVRDFLDEEEETEARRAMHELLPLMTLSVRESVQTVLDRPRRRCAFISGGVTNGPSNRLGVHSASSWNERAHRRDIEEGGRA
ncbi:hypothetical protein [Nonomuraea basaltis]|uniref:hypothetical protein n=1 Tax=Nonomuraea basaltis TaxID=2495887 RepID=UPI00110C55A3|nr:hypothetical protein [Nonomuraea basaltis]TMR91997.1 hypothetical protein EJK15_47120 [Nonomuraea basaltis]